MVQPCDAAPTTAVVQGRVLSSAINSAWTKTNLTVQLLRCNSNQLELPIVTICWFSSHGGRTPTKETSLEVLPRIPEQNLFYGTLRSPAAMMSKDIFDRNRWEDGAATRGNERVMETFFLTTQSPRCYGVLPLMPLQTVHSQRALHAGLSLGFQNLSTLPHGRRWNLDPNVPDRKMAFATRKMNNH